MTVDRKGRDVLDTAWEAFLFLTVGLVVFASVGCTPTQPTEPGGIGINITNNNNNGTGGGGNNGGTGASPGTCPPVTSVGNAVLGTGGLRSATIRVGQSIPLDTTPRSGTQTRPGPCDELSRPSWVVTQATLVCELNNSFVYTPQVTGKAVGQCQVRASVDGVQAPEPVVITVTN